MFLIFRPLIHYYGGSTKKGIIQYIIDYQVINVSVWKYSKQYSIIE